MMLPRWASRPTMENVGRLSQDMHPSGRLLLAGWGGGLTSRMTTNPCIHGKDRRIEKNLIFNVKQHILHCIILIACNTIQNFCIDKA